MYNRIYKLLIEATMSGASRAFLKVRKKDIPNEISSDLFKKIHDSVPRSPKRERQRLKADIRSVSRDFPRNNKSRNVYFAKTFKKQRNSISKIGRRFGT